MVLTAGRAFLRYKKAEQLFGFLIVALEEAYASSSATTGRSTNVM